MAKRRQWRNARAIAKVLLADRGFDADAVRADAEQRGSVPIIPAKQYQRVQIEIDGAIYALRNRIERCLQPVSKAASERMRAAVPGRLLKQVLNRLKNARRVATRHDKLV